MLQIDIPGFGDLRLEYLVLDYNGTLALDGALLPGVEERLRELAGKLEVHVVTADTFGTARAALSGLPCRIAVLESREQSAAKRAYVQRLGASASACIGNGRNDRMMLAAAARAIAVLQAEGAAAALLAAHVVAPTIADALDLLIHPLRLIATLRQ